MNQQETEQFAFRRKVARNLKFNYSQSLTDNVGELGQSAGGKKKKKTQKNLDLRNLKSIITPSKDT